MAALEQVTALLISFGAVVGMVSPLQLLLLVALECVFYSVNKCVLLVGWLDFIDGKKLGVCLSVCIFNVHSHLTHVRLSFILFSAHV